MAKRKKAPAGSWDVISRIQKIVQTTSEKQAAKLLGVTPEEIKKVVKISESRKPARGVIASKETLGAWKDRLQLAATRTINKQVKSVIDNKIPPMSHKKAASIISAGTGENWTGEGVESFADKLKQSEKPTVKWTEPGTPGPTEWEQTTYEKIERNRLKDYKSGEAHQFKHHGVRFVDKGYTWLNEDNTPRGLIKERTTHMTMKEVVHQVNDITNAKYVLVVEINYDEDGNPYYVVILDSDS